MPNFAVPRHRIVTEPTALDSGARLSSIERVALRGFVDGDDDVVAALFQQVETWAAGLRGPRRDEARLQLLAQTTAISRARVALL